MCTCFTLDRAEVTPAVNLSDLHMSCSPQRLCENLFLRCSHPVRLQCVYAKYTVILAHAHKNRAVCTRASEAWG